MVRIIGYGEDALTFWALTNMNRSILDEADDSDLLDYIIIYRPSFGRGSKSGATFGEFDSILVSKRFVYLIESKWEHSNEFKKRKGVIEITGVQQLRHRVFSWYLTRWKRNHTMSTFQDEYGSAFTDYFENELRKKTMPPVESTLAKNMEKVLTIIRNHCDRLDEPKNILLFFKNRNSKLIGTPSVDSKEPKFRTVVIDYPSIDNTDFFEM